MTIDANNTEPTTESVSVQVEREVDTDIGAYTNEADVVDTDGLRAAVDDWRSGEIDTDLLRDVVDYWRSGEQVS